MSFHPHLHLHHLHHKGVMRSRFSAGAFLKARVLFKGPGRQLGASPAGCLRTAGAARMAPPLLPPRKPAPHLRWVLDGRGVDERVSPPSSSSSNVNFTFMSLHLHSKFSPVPGVHAAHQEPLFSSSSLLHHLHLSTFNSHWACFSSPSPLISSPSGDSWCGQHGPPISSP